MKTFPSSGNLSRKEHFWAVSFGSLLSVPGTTVQEWANFFCKGPDSKYFRPCGPHKFSVTCTSLFLQPFKKYNILTLRTLFGLRVLLCR